MISYKEILNDKEIKKYINIIDENNNFYMSHGIKHINSLHVNNQFNCRGINLFVT